MMIKKEYPECPMFDPLCPYCTMDGKCTIEDPMEECDEYYYYHYGEEED